MGILCKFFYFQIIYLVYMMKMTTYFRYIAYIYHPVIFDLLQMVCNKFCILCFKDYQCFEKIG